MGMAILSFAGQWLAAIIGFLLIFFLVIPGIILVLGCIWAPFAVIWDNITTKNEENKEKKECDNKS